MLFSKEEDNSWNFRGGLLGDPMGYPRGPSIPYNSGSELFITRAVGAGLFAHRGTQKIPRPAGRSTITNPPLKLSILPHFCEIPKWTHFVALLTFEMADLWGFFGGPQNDTFFGFRVFVI